ncbi:RdgB/HAM1 family non-canonical purine NTP pyrophosphatase [Usitatibacter palustris]|uniref:dITP/XTP pyrophosphatase n=1 Tax=Usitatibacter palustris TaxID=2732487 RepID=A0A6M4H490_9PROT|nr:RdgB/HAM1 family non-canonical purine NTP pyrophosphatase [Usitatibacter palustris]QJR13304.1 dITP/XTP pyrophosphatase [Usitatibacter palustris]
MTRRVVIASNNAAKIKELKALLEPLGMEALEQSIFSISEAEEPYSTFVENALAKARHACEATGLPALADDSGLCVPALAGAPGVNSAYYAGRDGDRATRDARNNAELVNALRDLKDRSAYYYCVLVLVQTADDPCPIIADGTWHGEIVLDPRGARGFGYDPHFLLPFRGLTAGELFPEEKNRVSHRAKAIVALEAKLTALQAHA